jgi:hypothetical protein
MIGELLVTLGTCLGIQAAFVAVAAAFRFSLFRNRRQTVDLLCDLSARTEQI